MEGLEARRGPCRATTCGLLFIAGAPRIWGRMQLTRARHADRGLRAHRRPADRRAGRARRLDRLALPAALRLGLVLLGPARRRRPTAAGCWRRRRGALALERRYRPGTLVLETDIETADGAVRVIDFMPRRRDGPPQVVRIVEGLQRPGADAVGAVAAPRLRRRSSPGSTPCPTGSSPPPGRTPSTSARRAPIAVDDGAAVVEFPAVEGAREHFVHDAGTRPRSAARGSRAPTRRWRAPRPGGASGRAEAPMRAPTRMRCAPRWSSSRR